MQNNQLDSYKDFYIKTIDAHKKGFKLVLGGTGLGKTYGIQEAIKHCVALNRYASSKFIYLTNRHNLLTQMQADLINSTNPIKVTYLKSNLGVLIELEKIYNQNSNNGLEVLINKLEQMNFFAFKADYENNENIKNDLLKLAKNINAYIKNLGEKENASISATIKKELNISVANFFGKLKNQLKIIYAKDKHKHQEFLKNQLIWQLFPYIEFEQNEECQLLLVTTHKLMLGFFDGIRDLKIASIKNKIIFLDEFDFLYADILEIMCNQASIQNPLEFVRIFYERVEKLNAWQKTPEVEKLIASFSSVIKYIDDSCKKNDLNILDNKDFRISDSARKDENRARVIFQSKDLITPNPLYLIEEKSFWEVYYNPIEGAKNPRFLFNIIAISIRKILQVFNYNSSNLNLCDQVIKEIWNRKNDNQSGAYEKFIKENMLNFRSVTDKNQNSDKTNKNKKDLYEIGFSLTSLISSANSYDEQSCELNRVELLNTPENLIAKLSDENLLFALSATGDMHRNQKSFDINWLKKNAHYLEYKAEDYEFIKKLRDAKQKKRSPSEVILTKIQQLPQKSKLDNILQDILEINSNFFGEKKATKARKDRLAKTLNTIDFCLNSDAFNNLFFLTTFKQIKDFLQEASQGRLNNLSNKDGFFENNFIVKTEPEHQNKFFQLIWDNRHCYIIFLNAEDAKNLETEEDAAFIKSYKKAFTTKKNEIQNKVILITQYNSASNGINLICYDDKGTDKKNHADFNALYLIEPNYFWFNHINIEGDNAKNIEKQGLFYLTKLWYGRQISTRAFKVNLAKRDKDNPQIPDINSFNNLYRKTPEKTLSAIALYHQAIGRIERKNTSIEKIYIGLDTDILRDFYTYLTDEIFEDLRQRDQCLTSDLILKIQAEVLKLDEKEKIASNFNDFFADSEEIHKDNNRSRDLIQQMLSAIELVKNGALDKEKAEKVKSDWLLIRDLVLRHSLDVVYLESINKHLDVKRDFCFDSIYVDADTNLTTEISDDTIKIYHQNKTFFTDQANRFNWHLDFIYQIVQENPIINDYFIKNSYKTSFENKLGSYTNYFTPYIQQAILKGAIGEKSIEALLDYESISLEDNTQMEDLLFEVVDAKVSGACIYFDFKNFSESTLDKFALEQNEQSWDFNANFYPPNFIKKQVNKYKILQKVAKNPIFYVINLYSNTNREALFLNAQGEKVKENSSVIRILPSLLMQADKAKTNIFFEKLVTTIKTELKKND